MCNFRVSCSHHQHNSSCRCYCHHWALLLSFRACPLLPLWRNLIFIIIFNYHHFKLFHCRPSERCSLLCSIWRSVNVCYCGASCALLCSNYALYRPLRCFTSFVTSLRMTHLFTHIYVAQSYNQVSTNNLWHHLGILHPLNPPWLCMPVLCYHPSRHLGI